jgi:hypothetical protein
MERAARRGLLALGFAVAALLACWNPLSAPFGLLTGLGALIVSLRARHAPPPGRSAAWAGVAVAVVAMIASAAVLAIGAGVDRSPAGEPIVTPRSPGEVDRILDEAGRESRESRARAREDLERIEGAPLTPSGE